MDHITVELPDGTMLQMEEGSNVRDLAEKIGARLAKAAVAARLDGRAVDLKTGLVDGARVEIITDRSPDGLDVARHSAAHIMAHAVVEMYPNVKLGIGPTIEDGFYYDFLLEEPLNVNDLSQIEGKMREIVRADEPFARREISRNEAREIFADQPFKLELIDELEGETVSIYEEDGFVDLCRGPHVPSTGRTGAFKLLSVAGAYWRGDEKRPMLQRIYGTAWSNSKDLDAYLVRLAEAGKRDHRKLGRELDLFSFSEEVGPGLALWHPKGALMRKIIEDFWKDEHLKRGYDLVMVPHIAHVGLWERSGHWDFYRDSMFSPMDVEGSDYVVKPMNCPEHILIFKSATRSYRELPIRWAELGTVYRFERSGVLHGLLRVRGFTQDDAHIFCTVDQIEDEIMGVLDLTTYMLRTFGFSEHEIYLSTRPEKFVGTKANWEKATDALRGALEKRGLAYSIDPGEGVFYGPKIDVKIKDALGRAWQCTTIQVDFNLPERFNIKYKGADNLDHQPIMIHRAILGSLERFIGCLVEHYAGAFPVWLSPVQVMVLPIADRHNDYARSVSSRLEEVGVRVDVDTRVESVNKKIWDAQLMKMPYMLIVGDKEVESGSVAVRDREGDKGPKPLDEFAHELAVQLKPPVPEG
ncbi:MAG: threonine--tRNA ligase [Actinobacteria bacterium]|nr:threonine--tRNA ligase [Actinomycetota bacterium]